MTFHKKNTCKQNFYVGNPRNKPVVKSKSEKQTNKCVCVCIKIQIDYISANK